MKMADKIAGETSRFNVIGGKKAGNPALDINFPTDSFFNFSLFYFSANE